MKERPILFRGAMVRAILDGRKTQTRRVVKPTSGRHSIEDVISTPDSLAAFIRHRCPYGQPGDRLWVRETYRGPLNDGTFGYRATHAGPFTWESYTWRPSIHMPRAASRITLEITGVRVERLKEIGTADCWAEGIAASPDVDPVHEYCGLWESINGPGSWDANPWVWVLEFRRVGEQESGS